MNIELINKMYLGYSAKEEIERIKQWTQRKIKEIKENE
jgi:hypothetical protein